MRAAWFGIGLVLLLSGCAATFRENVTPSRPGTPTELPWRLNPELLTPANERIEFVVEQLAGHAPNRQALNDLVELASRYGGRPASWVMHRQGEPFKLEPNVSYVIVRYVGHQLPSFGLAYSREVNGRTLYFLIINQDVHRNFKVLMPIRRLEQQTLIHEYGHLLGLPVPHYGYYPKYPDWSGGMHCVSPDCPLSRPRPKAVLYNAFWIAFGHHYLVDYCADCREAISQAQAFWKAHPEKARRPVAKPKK